MGRDRITWDNELLERLSLATGKPVECLQKQIRRLARDLNIDLIWKNISENLAIIDE